LERIPSSATFLKENGQEKRGIRDVQIVAEAIQLRLEIGCERRNKKMMIPCAVKRVRKAP
jgi:hypothetical protein